ncbi:MAG: D-tyrosyl-tRNA(Tyr) deacylase [Abditibacteriota bacterium]|nr:D-tyrosyl-tRNA(Tyr) deacylase [Abditibacteriota bacterium]
MIAVIQRVLSASVTIDGEEHSAIGKGLLVLLGVKKGDTSAEAKYLADKTADLRIFEDDAGKMNLSVSDIGGEITVVSQFTLLADCSKGRRPAFTDAAPPPEAIPLYEEYISLLREKGFDVQTGVFGADMLVSLRNDGPVTIILEKNND